MADISAKICGINIESSFKSAVAFRDVRCDEISVKWLEAFSSYGLKTSQILVRRGDEVFNYELSFSLFNGNATFKISPDKLELAFQGATTARDLEIIEDCVAKTYERIPLPEIITSNISANAQAVFGSAQLMSAYLSRYANPAKQVVLAGTIAYIKSEKWPEQVRLTVDRSIIFPDGVFLMWSTDFRGSKVSREVFKTLKDVFLESAALLDLTFPKSD